MIAPRNTGEKPTEKTKGNFTGNIVFYSQDSIFIYIIKCEKGQFYKIGRAKDVYKRLMGNQVGCPYELSLLAWVRFRDVPLTIHAEDTLHKKYQKSCIRGEWYHWDNGWLWERYRYIAKLRGAIECSHEVKNITVTYRGEDNLPRYYIENFSG